MTPSLVIRPATADDDPQLREAIIELQEYERLRHSTRLPGDQIADAYLCWMRQRAEATGVVLVAENEHNFVGFVSGWIEETNNIAETAESNRFGYISDICVIPAFRGRGIAGQLLAEIERYLGRAGVTRLRITALSANSSAQAGYEHAGFTAYEIIYEKVVDAADATPKRGVPKGA